MSAAGDSFTASVQTFGELAERIRVGATDGHRVVVGVDGRSASGKSTFAVRLANTLEAPLVHTDDVAWHHSFFDWWPLLVEHVLVPFRAGQEVRWRPEPWHARGREGSIIVPVGSVLIVEGVSATRRELTDQLQFAVWMEVDPRLTEQRGLERDGPDGHDFWFEWQAAEDPFLEADKPWERADLIVDGAPTLAHDPNVQYVALMNRI